jgi:hypothetical protein
MINGDPRGASRGQALGCYDPPFRYQLGYIFDAHGRMVADVPEKDQAVLAVCRVRGWGRLQYRTDCDPGALQDMVGTLIAEALTQLWGANKLPSGGESVDTAGESVNTAGESVDTVGKNWHPVRCECEGCGGPKGSMG